MSAIQAGGDTLRIGIDVGGTKIAGVLLAEAADGDARGPNCWPSGRYRRGRAPNSSSTTSSPSSEP